MTKYLSEKIKAVSFFSMILVIFLHSYNIGPAGEGTADGLGYNFFVQDIISYGVTRIAVPLFFLISGYLFFLNTKGTLSEFKSKIVKRARTLALPYILWSIFGLAVYFFLQLAPVSKKFFANKLILDYSLVELLSKVFLNPIPYQLWFVRDLMVLVLLSPLIYWAIKFTRSYLILLFLPFWFIDFNIIIFSTESILFFAIGSSLAIHNDSSLQNNLGKNAALYTSIWIGLLFFKTILLYNNFSHAFALNLLYKTGILMGVLAVWTLYDVVARGVNISKQWFYPLFRHSFFLFAFHEPALTIVKKLLFFCLGQSEFMSLIIYLLTPLTIISICLIVGHFLNRLTPKFYGVITGGRG